MEVADASDRGLEGNARYEGFVVDLATEIAARVGFNFTIVITDMYGKLDKETNEWNGMIKELLEEVSVCVGVVLHMMRS